MASLALAKYSLSGYVLISVWRFSRPTSCRPCLTSSMALLYRILSGSAVLSALVDLLTLFFLWRICASLCVVLSSNNPVITNRAGRLTAAKEVRSKLHLSLESGVPRCGLPKPVGRLTAAKSDAASWLPVARNVRLYSYRKAGRSTTLHRRQ